MTLLGSNARGRMIHRAVIQRNTATGLDAHRQPAAPSWDPDAQATPCFAWVPSRREIADGDKVAVRYDVRVIFPAGTAITERERLASITDRRGTVKFQGPFAIVGVPSAQAHVEVLLERVTG